jgi:hypothetical protein
VICGFCCCAVSTCSKCQKEFKAGQKIGCANSGLHYCESDAKQLSKSNPIDAVDMSVIENE